MYCTYSKGDFSFHPGGKQQTLAVIARDRLPCVRHRFGALMRQNYSYPQHPHSSLNCLRPALQLPNPLRRISAAAASSSALQRASTSCVCSGTTPSLARQSDPAWLPAVVGRASSRISALRIASPDLCAAERKTRRATRSACAWENPDAGRCRSMSGLARKGSGKVGTL